MAIDDGQGGSCRVCGVYHLMESETLCTNCLRWALNEAAKAKTVSDALEIIRKELFGA